MAGGKAFGAAAGHRDYGRFLVSSGPYMVEGSEEVRYDLPAGQRSPVPGFEPRRSLSLVRNPAWERAGDDLRSARADRIELSIGTSLEEATRSVREGTADVLMNMWPPPQLSLELLNEYRTDPSLREHLYFFPRDFVRYMSMNLALPPLDDVHVRKAVNLVIDKARLVEIAGGQGIAEPATHVMLDSLEENLLLDYDPYRTPGAMGDLEAAGDEMALSKYDEDGDGRCDHPACKGLLGVGFAQGEGVPINESTTTLQAGSIVEDLRGIGIEVDLRELPPEELFGMLADPVEKIGLGINVAWGKDYPSGSTFASLFKGGSPHNFSLLGASAEELKRWGYRTASVPSVEDKLHECRNLVGNQQTPCWAEL
ncbi:MAG: hypothetical protein GEU71_18845, partial [Actinobacteria bacterium]|nr:hypothetical protein [Actinomycetota bacterium]